MITLAARSAPSNAPHGVKLRVSYGKVAEYQRRGVVHFHALIRLDAVDPADPDAILAPPTEITAADLAELVADATATTAFRTPDYADTTHSWPIGWGAQIDIRPLGLAGEQITSEAVAAYLAKYATKATEPTGMPITARMTAEAAEHYSDPDTHLGRLIAYAFQLGTRPARHGTPSSRKTTGTTPGAGCGAGPTCSASAATSPPSPAATPPPTRCCAPTGAPGDEPNNRTGDRRHRSKPIPGDRRDDVDRLRPHPRRHRLEHHRRRPTRRRSRRPRPRTPRPRPRRTHHRMTSARNQHRYETTRGAMNALLHTVEETAEILKISRWKVFELIRLSELRSVKIGGLRRIPAARDRRVHRSAARGGDLMAR